MGKRLQIFLGSLLFLFWVSGTGRAFAVETLSICRPCSRDFIPVAERVIEEMGLTAEISVKATSCLGACATPAVIEFRDTIYGDMDEARLRTMLEAAFP